MGPPRGIKLGADGDVDTTTRSLVLVRDAAATKQDINCALSVIISEYFIDERIGTIDFELWYDKNPPLSLIESAIRAKILSREGVTAVTAIESEFVTSERELIVRWEATGDVGILNGEVRV